MTGRHRTTDDDRSQDAPADGFRYRKLVAVDGDMSTTTSVRAGRRPRVGIASR